jgi:hypothetical protein
MKAFRTYILPLSFILILLFGCPQSGGNGGTAPVITDVAFYQCDNEDKYSCEESYSFSYGGYYYRRIYCADPDLDIQYSHCTILIYQNGEFVEYLGPIVKEIPPQSSSQGSFSNRKAVRISTKIGTYRYDYQLEDKKGNMSNIYEIFTVVE